MPTLKAPTDPQALKTRLRATKAATLSCYTVLLILFSLPTVFSVPPQPLTIWLLKTAPLLVFWPWLRKDRPRAYLGICFVALLYFIAAVESVFSSAAQWTHYLNLILICLLFVGAMLSARWIKMLALSADIHEEHAT